MPLPGPSLIYITPSLHRSCSGLIVTSYSKDEKNIRKIDKQLENLFEQYKIFKKNLDLKFDGDIRPELKGLF